MAHPLSLGKPEIWLPGMAGVDPLAQVYPGQAVIGGERLRVAQELSQPQPGIQRPAAARGRPLEVSGLPIGFQDKDVRLVKAARQPGPSVVRQAEGQPFAPLGGAFPGGQKRARGLLHPDPGAAECVFGGVRPLGAFQHPGSVAGDDFPERGQSGEFERVRHLTTPRLCSSQPHPPAFQCLGRWGPAGQTRVA